MTVHYGAPKGAHIGECHNLIKPTPEAPWSEARYCKTPTIALGGEFPLDRDICQKCRLRGEVFHEHIVSTFAKSIAEGGSVAEWLATAEEILSDTISRAEQALRTSRSLKNHRELIVHIQREEEHISAVRRELQLL